MKKKVSKKLPKKVAKKTVKKQAKKPSVTLKKAAKPKVEKQLAEIAEVKVLDRIDAELAKKPAKAVNRKGTVVIEADQDVDSAKPGRSVVMTGDGPKVVEDNGDID